MHQPKLINCFDRDFWKDLHRSISFLVRDIVYQDHVKISRLVEELKKAGVRKCSEQLIYAWADPEKENLPSLFQFLLLIKITETCTPIEHINYACGKKCLTEDRYQQLEAAYQVIGGVLKP